MHLQQANVEQKCLSSSQNISYGNKKKATSDTLASVRYVIRSLVDQNILQQAAKQRIPQSPHFLDRDYLNLCVCNITVDTIIRPYRSWQFSFDLWIKHRREWYYHTFKMNRNHFKLLHAQICFQESNSDKGQLQSILFFPKYAYPKAPKLTKSTRSARTKQCIAKESQYLGKPQLPNTWSILKKSANMEHAIQYANYLQHCFSSLPLLTQHWFYTLLGDAGLNKELSKYIISIAQKRLNTMISKTKAKSCSIKRLSRRTEFRFHTCYITTRPLHDPASDLMNFNHWALKFEGELSLLTIEFFAGPKGVKIRHLMNSTMSRRTFWYWWDPDVHQKEMEYSVYFTKRWKVIERFAFDDRKQITASLLAHIVAKWMLMGQNRKYHVFKNNCQHFVRDIVTVLDRKVALSLNSFLDHTTLTNLIPVIAIGDGLAEHARTLEISKQLGDALHEYGTKLKRTEKTKTTNHDEKNEKVV